MFRACAALSWIRLSSVGSFDFLGRVVERLLSSGQLNVRRVSGNWIASVCRLGACAFNYRPPVLLSYFTGDISLDDQIWGLCCVPI